ncbi:hypothetical protein Tco_0475246 [Tanacetum coccineum]
MVILSNPAHETLLFAANGLHTISPLSKSLPRESERHLLIPGLKASGRELLGLDRDLISGPFPGQVLTAVGIYAKTVAYICWLELLKLKQKTHGFGSKTAIQDFQAAMKELKDTSISAHAWLSHIPPEHWARSQFSGLLRNFFEQRIAAMIVDLTGDEDPTNEDGDIGVSVSFGDEIFLEGKKSQESNIGDSDNTRVVVFVILNMLVEQ